MSEEDSVTLGRDPSQNDINIQSSNIALRVKAALDDAAQMQLYLAATPDADLTVKGFTQGEVNTLKSAFVDLNKLAGIFIGAQTQGTAYDFRQFVDNLWGTGVRGGS